MDKKYWEKIGNSYDEEIFSVIDRDLKGLVKKLIGQVSSKRKTVLDLGCGVGKFVPFLAGKFKSVTALDISKSCLSHARRLNRKYENVEFIQADITKKKTSLPQSDVVLSVNSIMMPDPGKRETAFDNAAAGVKKGGSFILAVPSLESALYSISRLVQWNLKEGLSPADAVKTDMPEITRTNAQKTKQGIIEIQGVQTKHYLKEELQVLLQSRGLNIRSIEKIEYRWSTEFVDPPKWMKEPYPWDWAVHAVKA